MPSRRWSAALVAAGLVTGTLAACSSPGDNNSSSSSSSKASGPFKIGVLLPESGPLATTSTVYQAVAKNLGTSKIPGTETIDGRQVKVTVVDDLGTGPGTSSAVRQLLDSDNVDAREQAYRELAIEAKRQGVEYKPSELYSLIEDALQESKGNAVIRED